MNEIETWVTVIRVELDRAEKKFPAWPDDIVHAAAVVAEESGELVQAALDAYYGRGNLHAVRIEAVQTAAMALRLLKNLGVEEGMEVPPNPPK